MESDQLSRDLASLKIDRAAPPRSGTGSRLIWIAIVIGALGAIGWFVVYPRIHAALTTPEIQIGEIQLISPAQASVELTARCYSAPE